ncbi:MAG: hypothetical protein KAI66_23620 [Lentisphaeria bacterium]|nr:hypothetical protein [Lentisphaeria bacterium]
MRANPKGMLLPLCLCSLLCLADTAWQDKAAAVRLRAAPAARWAHTLRIDVPIEFQNEAKAAKALLSDGTALAASPILCADRMVGVEVMVTRLRGKIAKQPTPVEVYLLPKAATPPAAKTASKRPVLLRRMSQRLTTRPFTPQEMVRMAGPRRQRTYYAYGMAGMGVVPSQDSWKQPRKRLTAVLHWSTDLLCRKKELRAFGANSDQVAWFIMVDGAPVSHWRGGTRREKGGRMSEALPLEPGLHRLDFFVVQRHGETLPSFLTALSGTPPAALSGELLHGIRRSPVLQVELQQGGSTGTLRVTKAHAFSVRGTGRILNALQLASGTPSAPIAIGGTPLPEDRWILFSGRVRPAITMPLQKEKKTIGTATLPEQHLWLAAPQMGAELQLQTLTPVISASGTLSGRVVVELPSALPVETRKRAKLRWRLLDTKGTVLAHTLLDIPQQTHPLVPLSIPLLSRAHSLELDCLLDGLPLNSPLAILLVRPSDKTVLDLQARGKGLYVDGQRAVAVCAPRRPPPPRPGGSPRMRLAILDDFWAVRAGPEATLLPESWLGHTLGHAVIRIDTEASATQGAAPTLHKIQGLQKIIQQKPTTALLAVGGIDLRTGKKPKLLCRELMFLAQALSANGVRPIFMALPTLPGVSADTTRLAALLTKELALSLQMPVIDAFSNERMNGFGGRAFRQAFRAKGGTIWLDTPNDRGRLWLCELVKEQTTR